MFVENEQSYKSLKKCVMFFSYNHIKFVNRFKLIFSALFLSFIQLQYWSHTNTHIGVDLFSYKFFQLY